jgi:ADP-ribose pyrophosphatase YjhB (NUDIX family)
MRSFDFNYRFNKKNSKAKYYIEENPRLNKTVRKKSVLLCETSPNKILLIKNPTKNFWEIPGGHLLKKEDFRTAAIRELEEETSARINSDVTQLGIIIVNNTAICISHCSVVLSKKSRIDPDRGFRWIIKEFSITKAMKLLKLDSNLETKLIDQIKKLT